MATPQQVAANQANARLSTGPRTDAGKAASSQNARKHGLSGQYVPLAEHERPHFEQLEADLRSQVNPQGALQEIVFRDLVAAAWKRDTINRILAENCISTELALVADPPETVKRLLRYKAEQDRAFLRSYRLLQEMQTAAARREPEEAPSLARPLPLTKRTQSPPPYIPRETDFSIPCEPQTFAAAASAAPAPPL